MPHPMEDDDRLLDIPEPEFGSGIIGICDVCGVRQAVVVLARERFKLCVLDFLNKTWVKTDKKPGVPAPLYRSERVWFETEATPNGTAQGILLSPTKVVKRPAVLVTPDAYGLTTTLLDGAIRLAREGFEVFLPDTGKIEGVGAGLHLSLSSGARLRRGVPVHSKRVTGLLHLYTDALEYLRGREMVDPAKSAVVGFSYGGSLALAVAAQDTRLAAIALAYPMPVVPADLGKLVTAPLLCLLGSNDPAAARARAQLEAVGPDAKAPFVFAELPGARHHFLARDLSSYDLAAAEEGWGRLLGFLKQRLMPPPPRPPPPPVAKTSPLPPPATAGASASGSTARPVPAPSAASPSGSS